MPHEERIEEICRDLDRLAERLDDLILDLLHDAVRSNTGKRPDVERRATRARHAIERATVTLRQTTGASDEEP